MKIKEEQTKICSLQRTLEKFEREKQTNLIMALTLEPNSNQSSWKKILNTFSGSAHHDHSNHLLLWASHLQSNKPNTRISKSKSPSSPIVLKYQKLKPLDTKDTVTSRFNRDTNAYTLYVNQHILLQRETADHFPTDNKRDIESYDLMYG